jgi:hypothetical protein
MRRALPLPNYAEPVRRLLTLGDDGTLAPEEWRDYERESGFQADHVPELIRLATDTAVSFGKFADGRVIWASMHAWRALAQMRAHELVGPLLSVLGAFAADEPAMQEFPLVLGMIGSPAIPDIEASQLADPECRALPCPKQHWC